MEKIRLESSLADSVASDYPDLQLAEVVDRCQPSFRLLEEVFSPAEKLDHLLTALKLIVHLVSVVNVLLVLQEHLGAGCPTGGPGM